MYTVLLLKSQGQPLGLSMLFTVGTPLLFKWDPHLWATDTSFTVSPSKVGSIDGFWQTVWHLTKYMGN